MKNAAVSILRLQTPLPVVCHLLCLQSWLRLPLGQLTLFFSALSKCCGVSAAIRPSRLHLCLRLPAAPSPPGTGDVCGLLAVSDISLLSAV